MTLLFARSASGRLLRRWVPALLLALAACAKAPEPPLVVGTNVWPGYEPLYLARSLGSLDTHKVRLIEYPSATEVIRALRNHVLDAGALTLDEALLLGQDGIDVDVVLVMDVSNGADVVIGRPGIESPEQLRGRRIGAETTALGAFMVSRFLEVAGLAPDEVTVVPLTLDQHERAFRTGRVDAVVTFEPVKSRLLAAGGRVLFDSSKIPGEIVDVLVVRREALQARRAQLVHLLRAWFEALAYMRAKPEDAARRMAPRLGLPPEKVMDEYDGLLLPDAGENLRMLDGASPALAVAARKLVAVMRARNLLSARPDLTHLLEPAPLRRALEAQR